jgi:hypothetical protein
MDDNYYDLDDDFIDDGDLDMIDPDEDMELLADGDTSKFQSGRESVINNGANEEEGSDKEDNMDADGDNDQSYDPDKER